MIRRLNNSRTPNNKRFFTISDFKIYLPRRYICKMAQIVIKYSPEHLWEIKASFFAISSENSKYDFFGHFRKNFRKKSASIFVCIIRCFPYFDSDLFKNWNLITKFVLTITKWMNYIWTTKYGLTIARAVFVKCYFWLS